MRELKYSGSTGLSYRYSTIRFAGYTLLAFALAMTGCGWGVTTRGPVLTVDAKAPDFSLGSQSGETVSLYGLLKTGPVVLLFYRGHW